MSGLQLAVHQFRYDQKVFWRNPASLFFTVAFPVILLVIFGLIFGSAEVGTHGISATEYYVPAIISLAVISATMQSLAMSLVIARESGRLKRGRGTPMPAWAFIAGRVGNSLIVAYMMVVALAIIGLGLFGIDIPFARAPLIFLSVSVGAVAFSCLGVALTAAVPSEDAAAPVVNAILLPLYFISGIFIPDQELTSGIIAVADIFPIRAFFEANLGAYLENGPDFRIGELAIVAAWGLAGLLAAIKWFRWTPRR